MKAPMDRYKALYIAIYIYIISRYIVKLFQSIYLWKKVFILLKNLES